LALREVESRLGLADRLAGCLKDPRAPERIRHTLADIIRFRMMLIAAGYVGGIDADDLRTDPSSSWPRGGCLRGPICVRNRRSRG